MELHMALLPPSPVPLLASPVYWLSLYFYMQRGLIGAHIRRCRAAAWRRCTIAPAFLLQLPSIWQHTFLVRAPSCIMFTRFGSRICISM